MSAIIKQLILTLGATALGCICMSSAYAHNSQRVNPTNPCSLYAQLKNGPTNKALKVQVLGNQNGIVGVMILGLPKRVNATLNGIDVANLTTDQRQIICGREAVGELRSYDLRTSRMDAGYFQIQADTLVDGMSVSINH